MTYSINVTLGTLITAQGKNSTLRFKNLFKGGREVKIEAERALKKEKYCY